MSEIEKIRQGICGNLDEDFKYLTAEALKARKNNDDELFNKINALIYDIMPEKDKAEFREVFTGKASDFDKNINESLQMIAEGKFRNAQVLLYDLIKGIIKPEEKGVRYMSMESFIEPLIFHEVYDSESLIRPADFQYDFLYRLYAYVLFRQNDFKKAREALEEAVYWNPVSSKNLLQLAEAYKMEKNIDKAWETAKDCLKICWTNEDIAACYRVFGYCYIEKGELEKAVMLYALSYEYDETEMAVKELNYIKDKLGKKLKKPESETVKALLDKEGIQKGPNPMVLAALRGAADQTREKGNIKAAQSLYDIVLSLSADVKIKKQLREAQRKINNAHKNNTNKGTNKSGTN